MAMIIRVDEKKPKEPVQCPNCGSWDDIMVVGVNVDENDAPLYHCKACDQKFMQSLETHSEDE